MPRITRLFGDFVEAEQDGKRLDRIAYGVDADGVCRDAEAIEKAKNDARERERARRTRELQAKSESPDEEFDEPLDLDDPLTQYGTGIHLRLIDNKFVIARMDKNSSAE